MKEKTEMRPRIEKRDISIPATVESRADGRPGSIYGYPIVYNKDSEDMGFIEQVAPGAATKALKRSNVRALKNHDPSLIFGRQGVNLKLTEDENGLRYEAEPISTRLFQEVAEEVQLGLLTGQSFGFTVLSDKWSDLDTDKPKRTITEIGEIFDVGPVTYPAYTDTSVALRSMAAAKQQPDEDVFTVVVDSDTDEPDEYNFESREEMLLFKNKIKELRLSLNPTIPDESGADENPTIDPPSDLVEDDLLAEIRKLQERYKS